MTDVIVMTELTRGALGQISTQPDKPVERIFTGESHDVTLAAGLYLVVGGRTSGKSIFTRAMAARASATGWSDVGVLYVFEPGATDYPRKINKPTASYFEEPERFIDMASHGDLFEYLRRADNGSWIDKRKFADLGLLVIDSLGDPMRTFAQGERGRTGEGAAKEGFQPSDRVFVEKLNHMGEVLHLCILGTVNSDLVPFAHVLEGSCQGMLTVNGRDNATKRDRVTGRNIQEVTVSARDVSLAAQSLHYPDVGSFNYSSSDSIIHR